MGCIYASQLKDIALQGRIENGTDVLLEESDARGNVTARFEGKFLEHDSSKTGFDPKTLLQCEVIEGTWHKNGSEKRLPFYLRLSDMSGFGLKNRYGLDNDEVIHQGVYRFWKAVIQGDRKTVSAQIAYPLKTYIDKKVILIKDPREFLARYDSLFFGEYKSAYAEAIPRNMFVRDLGIMLDGPGVWFDWDGKVISLGPCCHRY